MASRRASVSTADIAEYVLGDDRRSMLSPGPVFEATPRPSRRLSVGGSDIAQYLGLWCTEGSWTSATADIASYLGLCGERKSSTKAVVAEDAGSDNESSGSEAMDDILDAY
jgi:hypothetical protein